MTGVIFYRLTSSGEPCGIPVSGVANFGVMQVSEDLSWHLAINTTDGSYYRVGRGSREYCEKKFQILHSAISENRNIDVTEW